MSIDLVEDEHGGVTVMLDGHPQSYVDVDDPEALHFEYVQHLAAVIDACTSGPVRITHVGGAGLTLPRWIHATRPGSPQIVLEPDVALTEVVRAELPLPRGHRIRVRPLAGREGVAGLRDGSADVVVVDAFAAGRVPAELQTVEFFADVARVLAADGLVAMNVPDEPRLPRVARVVAGMRAALGGGEVGGAEVALVAMNDVIKRRRYGNTVVVGSRAPLDLDEISRQVRRWPFPSGVVGGRALLTRLGDVRPLTDAAAEESPAAPEPGAWRVR